MKTKIQWITKTAVMLALLVALQMVTKSLGQLVTGSCVNFVLVMTTMLCGIGSGIVVAIVSPFVAFLLGIGPAFLPIVPGIAVGNALLVVIIWLVVNKKENASLKPGRCILAIATASLAKFSGLYLIVVKLVLPILNLKEKQIATISASFSWPQLATALIGSSIAMLCYPRLKKALDSSKK